MKTLLLALLIALLSGCAGTGTSTGTGAVSATGSETTGAGEARIDHSYKARSQSSRVRFIVLHYTVSNLADSLKTLTEQDVSSHYLLTDSASPMFYALVDESRQAGHAGVSSWKTYTHINNSSIGIEIVNPGYRDTPQGRVWYPYAPAQIDQLILLLRQIAARHQIPPENILGHSDIAPQRKIDPGPMFPWQRLADAGLIPWPDAERVAGRRAVYEQGLPELAWFQRQLALHGYEVPQSGVLDLATRNVIGAFQMKYRQSKYDGMPDAETAAILDVLTTPPVVFVPVPPVPICGSAGSSGAACAGPALP